jgi:hypothetical protein
MGRAQSAGTEVRNDLSEQHEQHQDCHEGKEADNRPAFWGWSPESKTSFQFFLLFRCGAGKGHGESPWGVLEVYVLGLRSAALGESTRPPP